MDLSPFRLRLTVIGALVLAAVVLFLANRVREKVETRTLMSEAAARPVLQSIDARIDSLLDRHDIRKEWRKSWTVTNPAKKFIRKERRIFVPRRFVSLDFNHELSRELSGLNAQVVATERTKESTVSMHILVDNTIVESIVFVLNRELE